jgi:hypothetical protein
MKSFDIFIWTSNCEDFTGEGLLARSFIKKIFKNKNDVKIFSNNNDLAFNFGKFSLIKKKDFKNSFIDKYLKLYYGIFLIWYYHLKGKKTAYINYLPLWNFLIFVLLPKKTILGPITGGVHYNNQQVLGKIIRKIFFPYFYKFSLKILFYKYKYAFFSTSMLKRYIPKKYLKRCVFNLALLAYQSNTNQSIKKDIDFIFYYKKHPNKFNDFIIKIINLLTLKKYKIYIVGDFLQTKGVINLGVLEKVKLLMYLKKCKFSVNNGENFLSLFALDCYASSIIIFYNNLLDSKENFFDHKYFIPINFSNTKMAYKKINNIIKKKKFFIKFNDSKIINKRKQIESSVLSLIPNNFTNTQIEVN